MPTDLHIANLMELQTKLLPSAAEVENLHIEDIFDLEDMKTFLLLGGGHDLPAFPCLQAIIFQNIEDNFQIWLAILEKCTPGVIRTLTFVHTAFDLPAASLTPHICAIFRRLDSLSFDLTTTLSRDAVPQLLQNCPNISKLAISHCDWIDKATGTTSLIFDDLSLIVIPLYNPRVTELTLGHGFANLGGYLAFFRAYPHLSRLTIEDMIFCEILDALTARELPSVLPGITHFSMSSESVVTANVLRVLNALFPSLEEFKFESESTLDLSSSRFEPGERKLFSHLLGLSLPCRFEEGTSTRDLFVFLKACNSMECLHLSNLSMDEEAIQYLTEMHEDPEFRGVVALSIERSTLSAEAFFALLLCFRPTVFRERYLRLNTPFPGALPGEGKLTAPVICDIHTQALRALFQAQGEEGSVFLMPSSDRITLQMSQACERLKAFTGLYDRLPEEVAASARPAAAAAAGTQVVAAASSSFFAAAAARSAAPRGEDSEDELNLGM